MPINAWLKPPCHLVVLFLGITLVLIVALGWLGGRLLQQDRALERQSVKDRLELAADRAAAAFTRRLAAIRYQGRLARGPWRIIPLRNPPIALAFVPWYGM